MNEFSTSAAAPVAKLIDEFHKLPGVGPNPGVLDWCTVLAGLVALAAIAVHGALYVAVKTEAALAARACGLAVTVSPVPSLLTVASLAATALVRPTVMNITGNIRSAFSCPLSSSGHWPP